MRAMAGVRIRFIPAPAGNMYDRQGCNGGSPVHPRACGEHLTMRRFIFALIGSSPRLRGTSLDNRVPDLLGRFIPAPAGNINRPPFLPPCAAVHPRACGEHLRTLRASRSVFGSSPRLRGTCFDLSGFFCDLRFIPAPAGNIPRCFLRKRR